MLTGILLSLLGAVGAGSADVFMRRAVNRLPLTLVLMVIMSIILIGVTLLGLLTAGPGAYVGLSLTFFLGVTAMAVLGYVIGQTLHITGLGKAGVTVASPILGATPLLALFLGVTLGGERPNLPTVLGAFVIVMGVVVVLSDRKRTQV